MIDRFLRVKGGIGNLFSIFPTLWCPRIFMVREIGSPKNGFINPLRGESRIELGQPLEENIGIKIFPLCREGGTVTIAWNITYSNRSLIPIVHNPVSIQILINEIAGYRSS